MTQVQRAFAAEIFALGKPTVLVILNGGSVDIGPELKAVSEHSPCSNGALSSGWMAAFTSDCDQIRRTRP